MGGNKVMNFLRKYMMLIATVVVVIAFYLITFGKTLYPMNIDSLISQNAYVFVLGTGMLLCILTGGNIDLSVGSVVCLAGGVGAMILKYIPNEMWPLAFVAMIAMGLLVGLWHGYWIAYRNVPPFIATLVGMLAFRGLANIIMQGKSTLEQLQDTVVNTCDGKAINGYATLVASLSKVLDTANSIGMEKSRIKSSIDMENLKHQHKTQQKASENPGTQNTVNIIAGREEVMKMLNKMSAQEIEAT